MICQPCRLNWSRTSSIRSVCWPRATQRTADGPPNRQTAKVTRSPVSAPRAATSTTSGSDRWSVVVATAAAAPTTAPVGTTGTIEPSRTRPNTSG